MPENKIAPKLIFCGDCQSRESWERYPRKDILTISGKISEFSYRCRVCGKLTWRPQEADLK